MISPSPTQPSTGQVVPAQQSEADRRGIAPSPAPEKPEPKRRGSVLKAILHPILKVLYYTIKWIRAHKIAALLATLLLLASIFVTAYVRTGNVPLVSSPNSVRDSIQGNPQLSDDVRNWLLALRSGNIDTMLSIQKSINRSTRPPDSALYVLQFSEPRAQVKWTNVSVTSIKAASDGLVDTYVEIDMTPSAAAAATGATKTVVLWHFSTDPGGRIYLLDYVSARTS